MATAYERWKERQKNKPNEEEENKTTTSAYERWEERQKKNTLEESIKFDTFESDLKTVGTTVEDIYKGWQPQETMANTRSTVESMRERINAFQEYQKLFGGEDAIDISDLANSYNTVLNDWDSLTETYGKYKDADSFNAYQTNVKKPIEEHEHEIKTLDEQLATIKAEKEKYDNWKIPKAGELNEEATKKRGVITYYTMSDQRAAEKARDGYFGNKSFDSQIKELEDKKAEQQKFLDDKKASKEKEEQDKLHAEMAKSQEGIAGFEKYLADEEATEEKEENKKWYEVLSGYLSGVNDASRGSAEMTTIYNIYASDDSYKKPTEEWTEEQNHVFGAYYNPDSPWYDIDKAYEYATQVNNAIKEKKANTEKQNVVDSATDNFWSGAAHTGGAILSSTLGLADYVDNLIEQSARGTITPKEHLTPFDYSQAVTEGISTELNENYGTLNENIHIIGGKGWGDVYGLGTSIAQSALSANTLGGVGTLVSYFGQGAAAGVDDALSRGATEEQALLYGTILGAAEGISENIGAEKLLKLGSANEIRKLLVNGLGKGGGKEFFKLLNKQGLSEAFEETFSSFVGQVADNWVLQDKSNFNATVEKYMASGMSKSEATQKAWIESIEGIAYDTLGGYISGGVHAGPQIGVAAIKTNAENKNIGSTIRENERVGDMLNIASMTPQESDAYKAYTEYANRGIKAENITDAQLGNLYGMAEANAISTLESKKSTVEQNEGEESGESTLSEREMAIENYANGMKEESEAKADLFRLVDDGRSNAGDYADSFNLVVELARNDYSQDYILNHRGVLSTAQVNSIYQSVVTNPKMAQQKRLNALIQEQGDNLEIKGTIDDSVIDYANTGAEGKVNWNSLHPNVKATIAYVTGFSTKVAGMDVQLVTNGADYGFSGQYDRQGNKMLIDINALSNRVTSADSKGRKDNARFIISTVAHEVTHWMEEKAKDLYAQYDKMVMDALTSGKYDEADVIARRQRLLQIAENKRAKKENRKPRKITEKEARREVIARASEDMLALSEEGKKFFESLTESEQKQFVDKIQEVLQNIKDWIKSVLSKLTSSAPEAQELRALAKDLDAISKKWDEMLRQSAKVNAAMKKAGINDYAIMESKEESVEQNSDIEFTYEGLSSTDFYTNSRIYSYDFLIAQKDMDVVELPAIDDILDNGRVSKNKVVDNAYENLDKVGTKVNDTSYLVSNNYTKRDIEINKTTITHGLHGDNKRMVTNGRLSSIIGDVVKNAIPINALPNQSKEAVGTYAMASYATDGKNEVVAIITVEIRTNKVTKVDYIDAGHSVSGRAKKIESGFAQSNGASGKNHIPYTDSKISIANLLEIVNSTHQGYLSDDVISNLNVERRGESKGIFSDIDEATLDDLNAQLREKQNQIYSAAMEMRKFDAKAAEEKLYAVMKKDGVSKEELDNALKEYRDWEKASGYGEAFKKHSDLKDEEKALRREIQKVEDRLHEELKEQISHFSEEDIKKYVSKAVRKYHTTSRLENASYLLTTGSMLDFSDGQGYRVKDHREISEILDLPDYAEYSDGMIAFMNMGNIRLQTYGIDVSAMPNAKQFSALRDIIFKVMREYDEFSVDFSNTKGYSEGSVTYGKGTSTSKIVADIKSFFETGVVPKYESSISEFLYSDIDDDIQTVINQSMTMAQAKDMIQRSFVSSMIEDFYDGKYKNGDEWLAGEGADEVGFYIENEYSIVQKYLNDIPGYIDGDILVQDILNAYVNKTLTGKVKQPTQWMDLSKGVAVADKRFYAPKEIKNAKKKLEIAKQRIDKSNKAKVTLI